MEFAVARAYGNIQQILGNASSAQGATARLGRESTAKREQGGSESVAVSLSAAAVTLRVSRETAKTQLTCIFLKCRVKSQTQLTRLVAGGPFFSDPAGGNQPGLS